MQMTLPQSNRSPRIFLLFALVLLIAGLALLAASQFSQLVDLASGDAIAHHGYNAVQVRNCLTQNGAFQVWENPITGRRANVCKLDDITYGLQIVAKDAQDIWHEITAFIKNSMTRIEQVEQYLRNCGYKPLP